MRFFGLLLILFIVFVTATLFIRLLVPFIVVPIVFPFVVSLAFDLSSRNPYASRTIFAISLTAGLALEILSSAPSGVFLITTLVSTMIITILYRRGTVRNSFLICVGVLFGALLFQHATLGISIGGNIDFLLLKRIILPVFIGTIIGIGYWVVFQYSIFYENTIRERI